MTFCSITKACFGTIGDLLCGVTLSLLAILVAVGIFGWLELVFRAVRHATSTCSAG